MNSYGTTLLLCLSLATTTGNAQRSRFTIAETKRIGDRLDLLLAYNNPGADLRRQQTDNDVKFYVHQAPPYSAQGSTRAGAREAAEGIYVGQARMGLKGHCTVRIDLRKHQLLHAPEPLYLAGVWGFGHRWGVVCSYQNKKVAFTVPQRSPTKAR
ncbi:MAG: hypothetical protein H6707_18965 [Deltaproteobacteria bacterium]|nr:hypothetical protein [Deltaproteobacteria bacterium]